MFSVEKVRFCNWFLTHASISVQYSYLKLKIVAWPTLEVIKYYYQLLTPVWMNVEYSRILAIEDVQRVLSSTTVRMVAKYLRLPETSWEERRMGWIGLRNPPEWFWRVDSFHSCWATRFAIELVEAWDLLGCWDTLISILYSLGASFFFLGIERTRAYLFNDID